MGLQSLSDTHKLGNWIFMVPASGFLVCKTGQSYLKHSESDTSVDFVPNKMSVLVQPDRTCSPKISGPCRGEAGRAVPDKNRIKVS